MAQLTLNIGSTANDGTGDTLRAAMEKVNTMFTELYAGPLSTGAFTLVGNEIAATRSNDDIVFKPAGTGSIVMPAITINDNNIQGTRSNEDIHLVASGTGHVVLGSIGITGTTLSSDDSTAININENLNVDGTIAITGTADITGVTSLGSTLDVTGATTLNSTLAVTGTTTLAGTATIDNLTFNDNTISSSSNADIRLEPGGTGTVVIDELTIDNQINIKDNVITTTQTNSNLVISPSGTGFVQINKVDVDSGTIDNTIIGGTTPAAGAFSTVFAEDTAIIDEITITDSTITSNITNADLNLGANGAGTVVINGISYPKADGATGNFLQTNGAGTLSFASLTAPSSLNYSEIGDATTSVASSTTTVINTFSSTAYRSAKYYISISDATNSRFEIVEANVCHGPSGDSTTEAFITVFGSTTNHTQSLATFSVDVVNDTVRLLATNISNDTAVFNFQRVLIDA